jgi:hypothetical protein
MVQLAPVGFDRKNKASPPAKPNVIAVAVRADYRLEASRWAGKVHDNLAARKMDSPLELSRSDAQGFFVDGVPIHTTSFDVPKQIGLVRGGW